MTKPFAIIIDDVFLFLNYFPMSPILSSLVKQTKKPQRNLPAVTYIDTIVNNVAVFNSFYLFETLILSSYFEKPSPIYKQIALIRH